MTEDGLIARWEVILFNPRVNAQRNPPIPSSKLSNQYGFHLLDTSLIKHLLPITEILQAVSNYKTVKVILLYKSRTSTKNPLLFFIGNTNLRPDLHVSSSTTSSSLQLVTMKGLIDPSLLFASFVLTSYCKGSSLSIDPSTLEFLAMIECKHLLHARNPLSKLIKGIYLSHGH